MSATGAGDHHFGERGRRLKEGGGGEAAPTLLEKHSLPPAENQISTSTVKADGGVRGGG